MTDKAPAKGYSRREFLYLGGVAGISLALSHWLKLSDSLFDVKHLGIRAIQYERQRIAALSELALNAPVNFRYPYDHPSAENMLVRMGVAAGGGVGPDSDVVAFHTLCTHQGGPLAGAYQAEYQALGPCPFHLSTFDLTRHGMVISGHATQGLPQVILETDGDDIFAVGVMGLIYGYFDNQVDPTSIGG